VPIVLKSGSFNLVEPSGPVQACNGIALPFAIMHVLVVWAWYFQLYCVGIHSKDGDTFLQHVGIHSFEYLASKPLKTSALTESTMIKYVILLNS